MEIRRKVAMDAQAKKKADAEAGIEEVKKEDSGDEADEQE